MSAFVDRLLGRLSSFRAISLFWIGYGLLHGALRLLRSDYLPFDETLAAELIQRQLLPAYTPRNPPLYEWMLWLTQWVTGQGPFGHTLLREGLIALSGIALFAVVRALSKDARLAAAASLSLVGFYWSGWYAHSALTQSLVLIPLVIVLVWVLDALCEKPGVPRGILLGAVFGLGILSKWSFALPIAAAFVALMFDERVRMRDLVSPLFAAATTAFFIVSPTALFLWVTEADVVGVSARNLTGEDASHAMRALIGLGRLPVAILTFLVPWLFFVGIGFYRVRASPQIGEADAATRLARRFAVAAAALLAFGIVVIGITNISERYLYPLGLPIIVAGMLIAGRSRAAESISRWVGGGALALGVVVLCLKAGLLVEAMIPDRPALRETTPYPALMDELQARGLGEAAFIADGFRLAAHIIELMPEAISVASETSRIVKPDTYTPERRCVAIWTDKVVPPRLVHRVTGAPETLNVAGSPGGLGARRSAVWQIFDLGTDSEACRTHFGTPRG